MAPLSQDREGTPAAEPAGNGQIVSGSFHGRRRAVFMAASGQLSGRLRAVSRGRRHSATATFTGDLAAPDLIRTAPAEALKERFFGVFCVLAGQRHAPHVESVGIDQLYRTASPRAPVHLRPGPTSPHPRASARELPRHATWPCDEGSCRILSQSARRGRSPVVGGWLVVR